jgi:hypothetical protein
VQNVLSLCELVYLESLPRHTDRPRAEFMHNPGCISRRVTSGEDVLRSPIKMGRSEPTAKPAVNCVALIAIPSFGPLTFVCLEGSLVDETA